jgi:thiol:disulfide interchange protein DsbD
MTAPGTKSAGRCRALLAFLSAVAFATPVAWAAASDGPLPVDEAFPMTASLVDGKLSLQADVKPGHYLFRDRFEFHVNGKDVGSAVAPKLTKLAHDKGKVKNDPTFGKTTVFEKPFVLELMPVTTSKTELELVFQGCSEVAGICYPPTKRVFAMTAGAKNVPAKALPPSSLKNQFKPQVSQ